MRANSHFRSSKTAGLGLVTSGDTVAVGSGWQAGTGVVVTHSISTSLRADGTIRTHEGKAFGGSVAGSQHAGPGVDAFFAHPFTTEEVSMQELFDSLRDGGLTPHPWGKEHDWQVLRWINSRALSTNTVRSRVFGVDRAQFGFPGLGMSLDDACEDYGTFQDVLVDLADLGGGMFREGVTSDLIWHHIFPYEQNSGGTFDKPGEIPQPADILLNLQDGDYYALSRFMLTVLVAIRHRVQLYPSVFARGGGEGLNSDPNPEGNVIRDPTTGETAPGGVTWEDTILGKPPHQASVLIPSVWGWNEWYYQNIVKKGEFLPHLEPATTTTYQQFALNVYNEASVDAPDTPASMGCYEGMVAIRKSLALAAFGQGIGDADPDSHADFGHCTQLWAKVEGKLPNFVTVSITPSVEGNMGVVAWLTNARTCARIT